MLARKYSNLNEFDPLDKNELFLSIYKRILKYRYSPYNHATNNVNVNAVKNLLNWLTIVRDN